MIELRWLLDPGHPSNHPDATYTLQYRFLVGYVDAGGAFNIMNAKWSDWLDVPYVSEK